MKLRNLFTALQLESRHGAVTYRGSFAVEGCQYAESGLAPLPIQRSAIRVIEHSVYADHVEKRVIKWQRFVDIIGSDHCIGNHIGLPFIHINPPGSAAASCSGLCRTRPSFLSARSEERRVGKECVSTCRSRG